MCCYLMQLPIHLLPFVTPCTYLVIGAKVSTQVHQSPFLKQFSFFCLYPPSIQAVPPNHCTVTD